MEKPLISSPAFSAVGKGGAGVLGGGQKNAKALDLLDLKQFETRLDQVLIGKLVSTTIHS
jgi:hypothetical protein